MDISILAHIQHPTLTCLVPSHFIFFARKTFEEDGLDVTFWQMITFWRRKAKDRKKLEPPLSLID